MRLSNLMKCGVLAIALVVVVPTAFTQEDAGFTAVEKSAEGLQEAILMTASKLVQVYGGDAVGPATLTFNGIFTDGSWQADFSGEYAGDPVALDFTGTYDDSKNAGAFTVTGTYGSGTWDGDGSWRYDIVDPQTIHMFWDSAASIIDGIGRLFKSDKRFTTPKKWVKSQLPGGRWHVVDYGEYRTTYFGIPVGPIAKEISNWVYPSDASSGGIAAVTASLLDDGIQLSGSADFDVGTFTGVVNLTPVPEAKGEEAAIAGLGTAGESCTPDDMECLEILTEFDTLLNEFQADVAADYEVTTALAAEYAALLELLVELFGPEPTATPVPTPTDLDMLGRTPFTDRTTAVATTNGFALASIDPYGRYAQLDSNLRLTLIGLQKLIVIKERQMNNAKALQVLIDRLRKLPAAQKVKPQLANAEKAALQAEVNWNAALTEYRKAAVLLETAGIESVVNPRRRIQSLIDDANRAYSSGDAFDNLGEAEFNSALGKITEARKLMEK